MKLGRGVVLAVFILIVGLVSAKSRRLAKTPVSTAKNDNLMQSKPVSNEDFWKTFRGGLIDSWNEQEKKPSPEKALAIVNTMNAVSDAFNQDYSFTELDRELCMSRLTLFLKDSKRQQLLKDFIQILKDNNASFPEQLSNVSMSLEQSVNNKNPEQFYAIYSTLENYFRGLPLKPLVMIDQAGWFARIKNAVRRGARRAYNYFF